MKCQPYKSLNLNKCNELLITIIKYTIILKFAYLNLGKYDDDRDDNVELQRIVPIMIIVLNFYYLIYTITLLIHEYVKPLKLTDKLK